MRKESIPAGNSGVDFTVTINIFGNMFVHPDSCLSEELFAIISLKKKYIFSATRKCIREKPSCPQKG